jgi:S-layer homology domain
MKKKSSSQSAFFNPRALIGLFVCFAGVLIAFFAFGAQPQGTAPDENTITRQDLVQMYRATAPATFVPPPCVAGSERFQDVPASNPFCPWIEELARQGITTGCTPTTFCPGATVTRQEMAVFIVRTAAGGPVASANVAADGTVRKSFNRFGGEPTVSHTGGTGLYIITFPGLEGQVFNTDSIALVSLDPGGNVPGEISRSSTGGNAIVRTYNSTGVLTDQNFDIVVFVPGPGP